MEETRRKRRNRMIIGFSILGAVIILVIVLIVACASSSSKKDAAKEGEYKPIETRTIANSVSTTGTIGSANSEEVTSQHFGTKVTEVYVKVGDEVSPGQVICQFDTTTYREQLTQLRESIATAKVNSAERQAESDRRAVEADNTRLRNIAEAEARLNSARVEYLQALIELETANKNYNDYMAVDGHHAYDTDAIQLQSIIESKRSNAELKSSNIETYENTLNNLTSYDNSSLYDISSTIDDTSADTISSMEEQAKELEKSISECTVRCTIGGTVTELNVEAGDNFTGSKVCLIEGVNDLLVEAEVSEYDIPDVAVGMKVMMKTEATRDDELVGYVTYVAPKASNSGSSSDGLGSLSGLIGMDMSSLTGGGSSGSSSATFLVKISLNNQNPRLRLGMNAKVSIITESVENALAVPIDAVMEDEDGSNYIEIATNYEEASKSNGSVDYEKEKVNIKTGLKGSYYIQIFGDVKAGDYVYVPAAEGDDSLDEIMNMMGSSAGV